MGIMGESSTVPGLDHMLYYSHHGPVQYSFPYPSLNHGCSERSEHSRALGPLPGWTFALAKTLQRRPPYNPPPAPNTLCPSGYISIYLFPVSPSPTLWGPHRIGLRQDISQLLRTVAMPSLLLLIRKTCFFPIIPLYLFLCTLCLPLRRLLQLLQRQCPAFTAFCWPS